MNKRILLFQLAFFITMMGFSQSLEEFNTQRLNLNKQGMMVLGTWALVNLASSPILSSRASGSERYFHQMNGLWNTVNLTLAGIGYYTAATADPSVLSLSESMSAQFSMEKILLFNAGLDLAYITAGIYLQQRAKSSFNNRERFNGYGQSLVLQGAFLLVFDLGFYWFQNQHGKGLFNMVDQLAVGPTAVQLTWYL